MHVITEGLTSVVKNQEQDPGAAENDDERIQQQKGREGGAPLLLLRSIEPQQLGEGNKGNRAVAGVKYEREKDCRWNQESFLPCHEMFHEKVERRHPEEEDKGIGTRLLGQSDLINHDHKGQSAWNGDPAGEQTCQKKDHRDRKDSEDQGDDSKISFRLGERVEEVSGHEKEGRMKVGRILFIILELRHETIA